MSEAGRPKWVKYVIIAVIIWALAFFAWLMLYGASGEHMEKSNAASTSCPSYVLMTNPVTGGAYMLDQCAETTVAGTRKVKSAETAEASSATYGKCKTRWIRWVATNNKGWDMFSIKMEKYWCYKNQKVTYAPKPTVTFWMAGWASVFWNKMGIESSNDYFSGDKWWHRSYRTAWWKRCIPGPWGCISTGEKRMTTDIYAYGNGGWDSY